jgi:tetratricopeptide (TPR) repeat protein
MRSAERLLASTGLAAASALLAACASLGGVFGEPSPTPAAAAKPDAAADSKPAGAAAPKPAAAVSPAAQRAFDAARQAMAAGRTAEAERGFVALTKSDPELSGPYANLGLIHRQAGKTAEATAALEKAVRLNQDSAELHNQLGVTYRIAGDFAKARASYERAIALDAAYAPAVLNLGILYDLYLWDGARALELYDRYLQLTPGGDVQVQRWVSDLRNRTARKGEAPGRPQQARTAARSAEVAK